MLKSCFLCNTVEVMNVGFHFYLLSIPFLWYYYCACSNACCMFTGEMTERTIAMVVEVVLVEVEVGMIGVIVAEIVDLVSRVEATGEVVQILDSIFPSTTKASVVK